MPEERTSCLYLTIMSSTYQTGVGVGIMCLTITLENKYIDMARLLCLYTPSYHDGRLSSPTPCRGNFIDVNILSHYQVLMSISCHNFKSWCQHLVTFLSLDVNILSHSQVLMSATSRSLSLSSLQTSQCSHTC